MKATWVIQYPDIEKKSEGFNSDKFTNGGHQNLYHISKCILEKDFKWNLSSDRSHLAMENACLLLTEFVIWKTLSSIGGHLVMYVNFSRWPSFGESHHLIEAVSRMRWFFSLNLF